MGFINEYIPEEDKKKFNINAANHFYRAGTRAWTVDRERDMFLLQRTGPGPESELGETDWAFYWRGHLLDIRMKFIENGEDKAANRGWERRRILSVKGLPRDMEPHRSALISDLRDALATLQVLGADSPFPPYAAYDVVLDA